MIYNIYYSNTFIINFESVNDDINEHSTEKAIKGSLIKLYLHTIDDKNKNMVESIFNENKEQSNEIDIIYEMYNNNELSIVRLLFIIDSCTAYFTISSSLIKKLMKDDTLELLEILFKNHLKIFDNNFFF